MTHRPASLSDHALRVSPPRSRGPLARSVVRGRRYTHEHVDVRALAPLELEALVDELYEVQVAVFDGVDRACFARYVADPDAFAAAVEVHRDADGRAVGYYAAQAHERVVDGRSCTVLRGEVGVLPGHRGLGRVAAFGARFALPILLSNPLRPAYGFACPVHPISYRMVARYAAGMWPRPEVAPSAAQRAFLLELAEAFGLERVEGRGELVRDVGWVTRQCDQAARAWSRVDDDAARFYVGHNPDYGRGTGLLVAFPLTVATALSAVARVSANRLRRRLFGRRSKDLRVAVSQ
ncbi:MAG: hypothetical protein H6719_36330 [Sandaracinaceae bacterium]|nr:hypothetical protein [Sandaracinaceae bacterium]